MEHRDWDSPKAGDWVADLENALAEVELIKEAMPAFDREAFLAGRQSPVFFGSAIKKS